VDPIPLDTAYTWLDARARGATRRQIQADGLEIARGLYISRAVPPTLVRRCRAWTRLLPDDATFGLETAGALLGAPVDAPPVIQVVLRPRPVLPRRAGLEVHVRQLTTQDIVDVGGLRITSGAQTFLDLAARLPPAELVAVGDALMRHGHLAADVLSERLRRAGRTRGVVRARACGPLLTGKSASRPESLIRYWVVDGGLPAPEVQIPILDRWGREVAHADLGYSAWRVALEYEGRQHADHDQFGRDIDRYSLMGADGWLLLRFAARHINGPRVVVERTRRALLSRGWRPTVS
jgi:AbiEi antitoxin C-terminal domain